MRLSRPAHGPLVGGPASAVGTCDPIVYGLTWTQPWATLVAIGAKRIETRSWGTPYRGWLAIHAAAGLRTVGGHSGLIDLCLNEPFRSALVSGGAGRLVPGESLPLGAIVAVATLEDCVSTYACKAGQGWVPSPRLKLSGQERAFGDFAEGRFAWLLANVRRLPMPIPCRGALGLWKVPTDVLAAIREQLGTIMQTQR